MSGRHRGLFWSAVAVAVVLFAGGSAYAYVGYERTGGADGAVKGYFSALQRGDAPQALGFGDLPNGTDALLTSTVLGEQQRIAPISNLSIVQVTRQGATAAVEVRYDLGFAAGRLSVSDTVPVVKRGRSWYLARVAVSTSLELLEAGDRASVAGAPVPDGAVLVFPGAAPISLDSPYLDVDPDTSVITFTGASQISIGVVPSAAGRSAAHKALAAALAGCVTAAADPRCPLPAGRSVPGSVRGRIAAGAVDRIPVIVTADRVGSLQLYGNVRVVGSYSKLDFNNVATTHRGAFDLAVSARAYPTSPLTIRWVEQ